MHLCSSDVSGTSNRASLTILLILCTVFLRNKVVFLEISDRQSQDTTHEFTFFRHRDSHRYLIGVVSRTYNTVQHPPMSVLLLDLGNARNRIQDTIINQDAATATLVDVNHFPLKGENGSTAMVVREN